MRNRYLILLMMFFLLVIVGGSALIVVVLRAQSARAITAAPETIPVRFLPTASPEQSDAIPFHISWQKNTLLVGTITGHFVVHHDTIEVTIEEGEVHFTTPNVEGFAVTEIRAAAISSEKSSIYGEAVSLPIPVTTAPTDGSYILHDMTFIVPCTAIDHNKPYWLEFELFTKAEGDHSEAHYFTPMYDKSQTFRLPQ